MKTEWRLFKESPVGQRFHQVYDRRQRAGRKPVARTICVGAGLLLVVIGIVLLPAPGPGSLVVALGAGLLAQESLFTARALDWTELRMRAIGAWCMSAWRWSSFTAKSLIVGVGLVPFGGAGFAAYVVISG